MNTINPIRIHVAFSANPLDIAIKQIFGAPVRFVETQEEADLILFTEVRQIEKGFDKKKSYAFLKLQLGSYPEMPPNVRIIADISVQAICEVISEVAATLAPTPASQEVVAEEPVVELLPDALRILVIDDTSKYIASAKKGLAGHCLTTATGYQEAMDLLDNEEFDVVLTDLHLPMSSLTMGNKFKLGEPVPYGILLMIEAARQGVKKVAVVTDLSHHDDPFSAAFDHYSRFPISIEGATVRMLHARVNEEGKDWADALVRITS
jgi:CheY-like chemotaxis protein